MKTVRQIIFFTIAMLAVSAMLAQTPPPAQQTNPELVALQKEWNDLQTKTQLDYSKIRDLTEVQEYLKDLQNAQMLQQRAQQVQAKASQPKVNPEAGKPQHVAPVLPAPTAPPAKK